MGLQRLTGAPFFLTCQAVLQGKILRIDKHGMILLVPFSQRGGDSGIFFAMHINLRDR
jgi:hypothetical protein